MDGASGSFYRWLVASSSAYEICECLCGVASRVGDMKNLLPRVRKQLCLEVQVLAALAIADQPRPIAERPRAHGNGVRVRAQFEFVEPVDRWCWQCHLFGELHHAAAVEHDGLAGDPLTAVGGEPTRGSSKVLNFAKTLERIHLSHLVTFVAFPQEA